MSMQENLKEAKALMDSFLARTGVDSPKGDPRERYLWTDAFAVQGCFALSNLLNDEGYKQKALNLIELVHATLGKHREDDERTGRISGLSEKDGKEHPTAGGLRIGKELPEDDPTSDWDRDGQYFHYLTRWFSALMAAYEETSDQKYAQWAAELMKASEAFIDRKGEDIRMYWKMNIDLSEPMVMSMGRHDPMEGLINTLSTINTLPEMEMPLKPLLEDFELLSADMNWFTDDSLGLGGLLLNTSRALRLQNDGVTLPKSVRPHFLFETAVTGLRYFTERKYRPDAEASSRLAFRECGMTLGLNTLRGMQEELEESGLDTADLRPYMKLTEEIENFWKKPQNREGGTWKDHQNINAVTLACSLLAYQKKVASL